MKKLSLGSGLLVVMLNSCTSTGDFEISNSDVPPSLTFQGVKYRTSNASSANVGAIVLKRTSGRDKLSYKTTPELRSITTKRVATFTKTSSKKVQLIAELTTTKVKELKDIKAGANYKSFQTGVYSLWRITDVKKLVDELNRPDNSYARNYLKNSKDMRVVVGIIRVKSHNFSSSTSGTWDVKLGGSSVKEDLTNTKETNISTDESGTTTEATKKGKNTPGLSISDGTVYAYEYARVLWNTDGTIADILVDYPNDWWQLIGDRDDHSYRNVSPIHPDFQN